jgi:hypothetical protein
MKARQVVNTERATVGIPDEQVDDYRQVVERVLSKAFGLKFPES